MNGVTYEFTAASVSAPAGMYTAELDGVRASWVVRPDGSAIGVQFNGGISGRDFEQAELQQLNELQFRNRCATSGACSRPSRSCCWQNRSATLEDQRPRGDARSRQRQLPVVTTTT